MMIDLEDEELPIASACGIIGTLLALSSPQYKNPTPEEVEMRKRENELVTGIANIQNEEAEKERALKRGYEALVDDDDDTLVHLFRD